MDGLARLRIVFAVNAGWWVLLVPAVPFLSPGAMGGDLLLAVLLAGVAAVGVVVILVVPLVSERVPLDVESEAALARSYSRRFLLRVGFVDLPVALGLVAWLLTGRPSVYFVAVPLTLLAAARAAPTPGRLALDQAEVTERGSALSLRDALARQPVTAS